jgi:ABC-2 type transport system permease protein
MNLSSIIKKEFWHIIRDPQTLLIIIAIPIVMMFLYGYAITMEMRHIPTIINDLSHSTESTNFIRQVSSSDFFRLQPQPVQAQNVDTIFRRNLAKCIITIPVDFAQTINSEQFTNIQILIDASDPNSAKLINSYLNTIISQYNQKLNANNLQAFTITPRFLYNPDLKSAFFFVPGLIAIILLLISTLLTSIAIVKEKENGTLEQILVSPVTSLQIILGKIIPYLGLAFMDGLLILWIGTIWFHVPNQGSLSLLLLSMLLYTFCGLSFGLLISTIAKTQQVALMLALMSTMLPTILLSGFMFPISSMPIILQMISKIIPATHFITIIRGIMLKGVGIQALAPQFIYLALLSTFLIVVSLKKFKNNLEN